MHMRGWTKAPHARASLPTTPKPRSAPHLCCLGHVATSHGRLLSRREALDFEKKERRKRIGPSAEVTKAGRRQGMWTECVWQVDRAAGRWVSVRTHGRERRPTL